MGYGQSDEKLGNFAGFLDSYYDLLDWIPISLYWVI